MNCDGPCPGIFASASQEKIMKKMGSLSTLCAGRTDHGHHRILQPIQNWGYRGGRTRYSPTLPASSLLFTSPCRKSFRNSSLVGWVQ
jgi:hypothetical protein